MSRPVRIVIVLVVLAAFFWLVPPVRIVRLHNVKGPAPTGSFDAARFVQQFWTNQLLPAVSRATPADELVALLRTDAAAARQKFGRRIGLSQTCNFFMAGTGTVVGVTDTEILVTMTPEATAPEVALQTGLIFGNAVRDGTGLIDVNDYPNSQDFNAISAELNRLIEQQVVPYLRQIAKPGARIRFAGCAELSGDTTAPMPVRVVPVLAEVE